MRITNVLAVVALLAILPEMACAQSLDLSIAGQSARHVTNGSFKSATVRVAGPQGYWYERTVHDTRAIQLNPAGLLDGTYLYSIQFAQAGLANGAGTGEADALGRQIGTQPGALAPSAVDGSFVIRAGQVNLAATGAQTQRSDAPKAMSPLRPKDQVIPDDLVVQGSICAGFDCVNNESFGFDTVRLKENNLRIKFEDTSVGAFPTNDWQLTANDSAGGGTDKFSIEDITGSRVPFTIVAGAATNSIYVDSSGRVGLRTSTPVLDLHVSTGNTPAMRLEQTGASGFTPQTWDVAGNEANFFVRDVTSGSRLPFRIRPGAPTSSIDISADGDVGVGTASPGAKLDVRGDVQVHGNITQLSSRNAKTDFMPIDPTAVLEEVARLPITTWRYNDAAAHDRHLGPVAQDFHAAFGLGRDAEHIAPNDLAGVALTAVQALQHELLLRDQTIARLAERLAALEARQD
jgi:hypothetical protein